ncbi:hypothetical protein B0H14DRAFT_2562357 [Mycena olivaceomarginata]|nr:hypothetical protein B0H14DRAFT_2562357 [Mycena olivaceomarginata]
MAAAAGWGNTDGTGWATGRGWGNSHGHGWGNSSGWSDTTSEEAPTWDGVTRFPKTRGKKRRQCRCRHMRRLAAEAEAKAGAVAAYCRAFGRGLVVRPASAFFWIVARLARWGNCLAIPVHTHCRPDVANKKLEDLPLPIAPLSLTVLFPLLLRQSGTDSRHSFSSNAQEEKNERLPVLAIGSQAPEAALLVITTLLEGGGRHFDWNDVMDILSDQRLWLSPIDAGFIGPNEVTFVGNVGPVDGVQVSGSGQI